MISKISLAMSRQQSFGHFSRNSKKNIENALKEYYKSERADDTLTRDDKINLENLDNSFLEVSAYKIKNSNDVYVSIYDPVTLADYFTGNIQISGRLTNKLRNICNISERNRYTLTH